MANEVKEIVVTGGPCAGKTTVLSRIPEKLRDWGWRIFVVPEAATMIINGGMPDIKDVLAMDQEKMFSFQKAITMLQINLRKNFEKGGLAGPISTNHAEHLSLRNIKTHVFERPKFSIRTKIFFT